MTVIKRGLNLPLEGVPEQRVEVARQTRRVALIGDDYVGMKPTMLVSEGDRVKLGQPVFEDKKTPGVLYTAPACGRVVEVNRGAKRKFESLVIEVEGDEAVEFGTWGEGELAGLDRESIVQRLVESGLWVTLRTRPYGKVPAPESQPAAIFVQAMDTNPLAADPLLALPGRESHWVRGLSLLTRLTEGPVYVCKSPAASLAGEGISRVRLESFEGPHPAGLPGTHIHFLEPVGPGKTVWYLGFQDVLALGALTETGRIDVRRLVSLAGPRVENPRVLETRLGTDLLELTEGELIGENNRIISGSVLCGRKVIEPVHFLGRYATQVSVLEEGNHREFLGWQKPGFEKFSTTRVFASALLKNKRFAMTTSTEGSERAMVPLGTYERVMPLDILPTQLLRALIVRDTESAQQLGALELEEEDLALCTFVCPGKYEYGSILRDNLRKIEVEG
jgi:Na+-transporting NADH:ubiquinone oxidoreductase subunit A